MPRTRGRTWQHGVGRRKLVQYGNARTERTLSTTAVPEVNVAWKQLGASFPTELCLALGGSPLENQGGDSLRVTGSGRCRVSLQLKSKWDESIFTKGCIQALESWLPRNIYIVAGVFIAISLYWRCKPEGRNPGDARVRDLRGSARS